MTVKTLIIRLTRTTLNFVALLSFALVAACRQDVPVADVAADANSIAARTYSRWIDAQGNIALPTNFELDWVHLGSWAVLDQGQVKDFHGVYAPREEVLFYQRNGRFPDGAILVKDVRKARGSKHTTGDAFWAEDIQVWFVMVKDEKKRFPGNPLWGEGWGWGLYKGGDRQRQAATDYKKDCLQCHVPVKDKDWLYAYGYPILGPVAASQAPPRSKTEIPSPMKPNEASAKSGETIFGQCSACHSLKPGQHGIGPSLAGLAGRKAGSSAGFSYSEAMKNSSVTWSRATLDAHLRDVKGFISGNNMALMAPLGVPQAEDRAALIEFLLQK